MEEELFIPKTKHKGLKIIIAILLIAGLAAGGYFLYQYKFNNPKVIVNTILNEAKASVNETFSKVDEGKMYHINGHVKMDFNIKGDMGEFFDIIKDLELQFDTETDFKNNISNFTINSKYKNEKLADIKGYYEDKTVYVLLDGIYDKYLKMKVEDLKNTNNSGNENNISTKDLNAVYEGLIDALQKEIDKNEIKKADAKITIDGKNVDVINNYLELKDKEVNTFVKGLATTLLDDKEFTDALSIFVGDDAKELLKQIIQNIDEVEYQGVYRINFYTDKSLLNKKLVSIRQEIIQNGESISTKVDIVSDDEVLITLSEDGADVIFRIKANNSTINLTLSEIVGGESISAEININYEKISNITKPDVSNSKNVEDLNEKDYKEIQNKIVQNKNLVALVERFEKIMKNGV